MLRTAYFQRFLSTFLTLVFISPDALALTHTIADPGTFVRVEDVKHIAHLEGLPVGWKDEHTAYLGVSSNDALGNPSDDVFEFFISEAELAAASFELSFSVTGVEDADATPMVLNGQNSYGNVAQQEKQGWQRGSMTIMSDQLKVGRNTVLFTLPEGVDQISVKQVSLTPSTGMVVPTSPMVLTEAVSQDFKAVLSSSYYANLGREKASGLEELPAYALSKSQVAGIPASFTNLTRGAVAYRVVGQRDSISHVTIGVDPSIGYSRLREVKVFYFDYEQKDWVQAHVSKVNHASFTLEADGEGGTDYFAAMIKTPDMPEAAAFMPTSISDLEPANPATGINLIQPPTANQQGDANISYPISIPAGRQGMQPQVSLNYSSSGGSGWAGFGWSVPVQSISVDTRFGVPTFDATLQSEVYMLDGESLHGENGDKANRPTASGGNAVYPTRQTTSPQQFFTKQQSAYRTIERMGTSTSTYCWVVTDANGTKSYYGTSNGTSVDVNAVLKSDQGNITKWFLKKVQDRYGNNIIYTYQHNTFTGTDIKSGGKNCYLSKIQYTGYNSTPGKYSVEFSSTGSRADARVNLTSGVKEVDDRQLTKIEVKYDGTLIKDYRLDYITGDFGKKLLESIGEYHGGTLFYEHEFTYNQVGSIKLSTTPEVIKFKDLLASSQIYDDIDPGFVQKAMIPVMPASMLKTTQTSGWTTGGALGTGATPVMVDGTPTKEWTFSAKLGYSENYSHDKVSMQDVNGDGLQDIIIANRGNTSYAYRPMQIDDNGKITFGAPREIVGSKLYKSTSQSINSGIDYVTGFGLFNFGLNWNHSTSKVKRYLLDYNGDGILDRTVPVSGGGLKVQFGMLAEDGTLSFTNSSIYTLNPVMKGAALQSYSNPDVKSFEVVKVWTAPVSGTININSNPTIADLSLTGNAVVSIQHDGVFLQNPVPANGASFNQSVGVTKGDQLIFRLSPGVDGQQDLFTWNPQVTYAQSLPSDGNGSKYTSSTYDSDFVLSGKEGVTFTGDKEIKVTLNRDGFDFSDDIYYRITVTENDTVNQTTTDHVYYDRLDQNATSYGTMSAPFMGSFATVPGVVASDYCQLSIEVMSHSNVDWKDVEIRPTVEIRSNCDDGPIVFYPNVGYRFFNGVKALKGPTALNLPSGSYEILPEVSENKSAIDNVFSGVSGVDVDQTIYFVVKSGGKYICKKALILHKDVAGTGSNTYRLYTLAQNEGTPVNTTSAYIYTGTATGTFSHSEVINGTVTLEFFAENTPFAEAALEYITQNLNGFNVVNSSSSIVQVFPPTAPQNLFYAYSDQIGTMQKGWGHFAWSGEANDPIDPAQMQIAGTAEALALTSPAQEVTKADVEHMNPWDNSFFSLTPVRSENARGLRTYQETLLSTLEDKDHYAVFGSYMGHYRKTGVMSPGYFGEEEESTPTQSGFAGVYGATAAPRINKSNSLSQNVGASLGWFGTSVSTSTSDPLVFFGNSPSAFQDMNGDGMPDLVLQDGKDVKIQYTLPGGGHKNAVVAVSGERNSKSLSSGYGITASGNYKNDDLRYIDKGSLGLSAGVNFGETVQDIEYVDVNGDGLVDRVYGNRGTDQVALNTGTSFETKKNYALPAGISSVNESTQSPADLSSGLKGALQGASVSIGYLARSFNAGININNSGSRSKTVGMDLNGDGLSDIIKTDGSRHMVYLNTGTGYVLHKDGTATVDLDLSQELSQSQSFGMSGNAGATIGIPIFLNGKLSISVNGGANYSVNKLRSSFMDINGDGAVDFVDAQENGDLHVYYSNVVKSNYLTSVSNPLGGSFDIDYKLVGHRRGAYDTEVKTHRADEKVLWDMPSGKWVLAQVTIHDGVNIATDGGVDLDGDDSMQIFFDYDGGIQNRREKAFAGFTRVETRQQNQAGSESSYPKKYLTEVVEYLAPNALSFSDLVKHDYQKGLVRGTYALYHEESNATSHTVALISAQNSTYDFRVVDIADGSATLGQVKKSGTSFETVDWGTIGESATVFPAVTNSEALNIPQLSQNTLYHSQEFELAYDSYFNVTRYQDKAEMTANGISETIEETIFSTRVEYHRQTNTCSTLVGNTPVYQDEFVKKYVIQPESGYSGYSVDTLWLMDFSGNCPPSNIYGMNVCGSDLGVFVTHHYKETPETTYVKKTSTNAVYNSDRIAVMDYFTPSQAGGRTGVLKKHSIHLGSTASNPVRESEVTALTTDKKSVATMRTTLNSTEYAVNDLRYDGYGNVTQIQGPKNHANQRSLLKYTYDATLHQYVTGISNQFNESVCNTYDYHTGQLLQTIGINGHPMVYEYDAFNRLEKVWAPREIYIGNSAPTIQYDYRLYTVNSGTVVPARAITTHNLANLTNTSVSFTPELCGKAFDFSARPELGSGVRTATFVDGNAKAVQLQTEQSTTSNGFNGSSFMISGPESVDKFGRTSQVYADFSSTSSISGIGSFGTFAGVINLSTVDLMQKDVLYDYNNRVTSSDTWTAESGTTAGQWVTTQMQYDWNDDLISGKDQYFEKTSVLSQASGLTNSTPNIINATYTDARGHKVGTITYGATASDDITTQFNYNPIGELIEVVDPIGLSTFYEYDLAGRVTREKHPDRGVTRTVYDPASNVIQLETPGTLTFGGSVTMEYDYNRLVHKYMPLSAGADLYDIAYTYGTKGDGRNGAGRITQVIQGQGFKTDLLRYDELGNVVEENTTMDVPLYGYKGFTTTKRYDSFGRILQATYPDGDQVTYGYTALGELHTIDSKVGGTTQSIVSGILYNGYGQISKLSYGNGTYTDYDYNVTGSGASTLKKNTLFKTTTTAKEQGTTSQSTVLERKYTYNTQGMVTQLDRDVAGTLMNSSAGTTVPLSDKYSYDAFGRFDTHQHAIGGSTEYTLDMTYNKAGGIVKKDALATGITNFQDLNYTLNYNYSANNPHQLADVIDSKSGAQSHYQYNSSGSIQEIQDHAAGGPQSFFWNEEQWLSGVSNYLGVHHYVYDYKGERVMKSSVMQSSVQVNDKNIDDVQYLEPYTLYINPYYVVTELQGGDKVSKHYYMNTQRVATDISINYQAQESMAGPQQPNARDPKKPSEDTASVNYNAAFADLQSTLTALGHQKLEVNGLGQQPTLEEYYPELVRETAFNATAAKNAPESTTRVLFWYHPDYLGNVDLVTERDGKTYEFFTYNPWGEEMHQYNANTFSFSSPYRFNSKEKDEETGLHYYGARYYQSKLSVWMSVDPLAHRGQQYSPFVFSFDSPINFTDPNGKWPILPIIKLTGYLMEKYGDRNTVKEIGYGLNHPINALTVGTADFPNWAITRIASNFEINLKNQAGMRSGSEGDEGNAFRHTLWQAMITKEFNASEAERIGATHEDSLPPNMEQRSFTDLHDADTMADLLNNSIGREIGIEFGELGNKDLAIVTLCEFRNSGLWVVKGNEENGFIVERHKLSDQEFKIGLEVLNTKGNDGLNN
jgi:RHS repeat-associated protein